MDDRISRRDGLRLITAGGLLGVAGSPFARAQAGSSPVRLDAWDRTHDRVFLGGSFWANPMEDWRVADGWAECQVNAANRSIHSLTHQLTNPQGTFAMSVRVGQRKPAKKDGGAGFRIGVRSDLNEHRSNCFAGGGINAGLVGGQLQLGKKTRKLDRAANPADFLLELTGKPSGNRYELTLIARSAAGEEAGSLRQVVNPEAILGNVAVVSHYTGPKNRKEGEPGYRFTEWTAGGDSFTVSPEHQFGPVLWSMYSLTDSRSEEGFVLKISALTAPLGENDNRMVELNVRPEGRLWQTLGEATLDPDAWTATFRIPNWDEKTALPYRFIYREKHKDGSLSVHEWGGTIRANPAGRPVRLAALTCQNDYGFPYAPVAENLVKLDPDMLYFSGDQLYESHGGFGIIREPADPAILNYLRKFYQFGWAFRDAMRNAPTLCIPDDHDVFQGNIWGEGGAPMKNLDQGASSKGGYRQPPKMVNVVHRTNCGHHPDFHDPTPSKQDISVYYGEMIYGGVGFAIIGDRQFKSGPERVETGSGRADHVRDPDFDTAALDKPGLVLLGERQEKFLEEWGDDWRGHRMKVLLSETVFAGVATHHGNANGYLKADLDSGGWPQTARNRAARILRKSQALHINGDQHLTTLSQYGADKQRDSIWSFCTPAIAAGYPRWWRPDEMGMPHKNRPRHGHPNTGEFLDGFGNKVYVYAVGNPEVGTKKNRYEKAHQKGSGFGMVTIDTEKKTYHIESFRFLIDATDGKPGNQFPGWPVTIRQKENGGENVLD